MKTTRRAGHREIWGSGFHAGVLAANNGGEMNPSRLQSIENGLSGIAKKVYDHVPIGEPWHSHQIGSEMRRVLQSTIDNATLNGCLNSLASQGLIKERPPGHFIRVGIKEKPAPSKLVKDDPIKPERSFMATEKTDDLLSTAGQIAAELRKSADKVEEFGLACAKKISEKEKENGLVRQLKELLKE